MNHKKCELQSEFQKWSSLLFFKTCELILFVILKAELCLERWNQSCRGHE